MPTVTIIMALHIRPGDGDDQTCLQGDEPQKGQEHRRPTKPLLAADQGRIVRFPLCPGRC